MTAAKGLSKNVAAEGPLLSMFSVLLLMAGASGVALLDAGLMVWSMAAFQIVKVQVMCHPVQWKPSRFGADKEAFVSIPDHACWAHRCEEFFVGQFVMRTGIGLYHESSHHGNVRMTLGELGQL